MELSPHQVRLSEVLSRRINRTPSEAAAASSAEEVLRQAQLTNPEEGLALAPSGWHPVRASFEVDKVTSHCECVVQGPLSFNERQRLCLLVFSTQFVQPKS